MSAGTGYIDFTEINPDQAIKVRINAIYGNSLELYFKFFTTTDGVKVAHDVSSYAFVFSISNKELTTLEFQVTNAMWTRPAVNEIKYVITNLNYAVATHAIDFTCTYSDGVIQTMMDGELVIRRREKKI